ncbi:MAG TPA: hypothetical protein VFW44_18595 [Bryobacteraceae bacterium]|nr:hypothetical protein [Bryobacteraceae bacterium]
MTDDELDQRLRESVLAEDVDTTRVAAAVRARIADRRVHIRGWAIAAAGIIAMIAASAWSYRMFQHAQATPAVCSAAVLDHQREIVQGEPREWLTDLTAIQALAQKQNVAGSEVIALQNTGYRLERARLCLLQKQIFLHLVYSRDGHEFSVYLRPPGHEFDRTVVGSGSLAYFETARVAAVFVGADAEAFARAGAKLL